MSKSLGNFITVHDLLQRGVRGEVIRFALLSAHYAKPLDWNDKLLEDCTKQLNKFYAAMNGVEQVSEVAPEMIAALSDDLNLPKAFAVLHSLQAHQLQAAGAMLGLLQQSPQTWLATAKNIGLSEAEIAELIAKRAEAKIAKNWLDADRIRAELLAQNITLKDNPDGTTSWS
jgi:cysteinyl-tRNA synthetase